MSDAALSAPPSSVGSAGLICLLVLVYFFSSWYKWRTSPLRRISGCRSTNYIWGEFFTILVEPFMQPHQQWWKNALLQKTSVPLLSYSTVMGKWSVVVLDPDIVKMILTAPASKDPVRFPKKTLLLHEMIGYGLVTLDGPVWSRHRRIIQPAFSIGRLKDIVQRSVPAITKAFIEAWHKAEDGREIDVASHMSALLLDIIGQNALCHDFGAVKMVDKWAQQEDAEHAVGEVNDLFVSALTDTFKKSEIAVVFAAFGVPWAFKYAIPSAQRARHMLNRAVDDMIENALRKSQSKSESLLQVLLDAKSASLTKAELRDELKTLVAAGHETTSTWCHWALYALAKYPDVQQRVYDDVCKHVEVDGDATDLETVEKMEYFNAFLSEVLRLYPPICTIIRYAVRTERWKGYTIPPMTRIVIPIYLLHRHPDHWSNPLEFIPERWLSQENEEKRHRFSYLPFSIGTRNCIGQRLAQAQAKLVLVQIVRAFWMELAPGLRNTEFRLKNAVSLKAKPAVKICIKAR